LLCLAGTGLIGVAAALLLHHDASLEAASSGAPDSRAAATKVARS
jgi:hypothetical protein